eukprot:5628190-Pleurochrysis_carterae.AAC.1
MYSRLVLCSLPLRTRALSLRVSKKCCFLITVTFVACRGRDLRRARCVGSVIGSEGGNSGERYRQ